MKIDEQGREYDFDFEEFDINKLQFKELGEYWIASAIVRMPSGKFCSYSFKYDEKDREIVDWKSIAYRSAVQALKDWDNLS